MSSEVSNISYGNRKSGEVEGRASWKIGTSVQGMKGGLGVYYALRMKAKLRVD